MCLYLCNMSVVFVQDLCNIDEVFVKYLCQMNVARVWQWCGMCVVCVRGSFLQEQPPFEV